MLLLFGIFEWFFVIIISEKVKGKTTFNSPWMNYLSEKQLTLILFSLIALGRSFIVLLIFTTPLALQQLWILPACFNSLYFHAKCWLQGVKFSLTKILASDWNPNFCCPVFYLSSTFFSRIALQFFLFTKRTIVVFFDLPIWWQSSISNLSILTLIWYKTSITFSSNWSSETLSGMSVCPGCYVCCTDPAYSNQFPTLKFDSSIFQSFDEVMNFLQGVLQW